ncbi:hypothetical protein, partial [Umezakia ovalisporum]|uniref:hypothetical protein n=1 Tax=Umezakia ovalisporum TaxID=75695 RepID=UPI0039C5F78C
MNKLEFLFFQLFESLFLTDKVFYRSFRPPLDEDSLNEKLSEFKLQGTGLECLFRVRNGNEDYSFNTPEFMSFGYLLSIEEAIRHFKQDDFFVNNKMFPFISSLDGSFVSLNIKSKRNSNLLVYSPFIPMIKPESIYDNLEL